MKQMKQTYNLGQCLLLIKLNQNETMRQILFQVFYFILFFFL